MSKEYVWRACKQVYGLTDSGREWYLLVRNTLISAGYVGSDYDASLYTYRQGETLLGIVSVHVDDFLITGTAQHVQTTVDVLRKAFTVGSLKQDAFTFLGLGISKQEDGITCRTPHHI